MQYFGILFNPNYLNKEPIFELLRKLHSEKQLSFFKLPEQNGILPEFINTLSDYNRIDCVLTFGGDGTFLRALDFSLKSDAPLLGINLGKLGFLSESSLKELEKSIDDLKNNRFKVQKRMLLKVQVRKDQRLVFNSLALNDAVIHRGTAPKLIDVNVSSNRRFVIETRCDGFIVSTPTGSTAYNLSAGGPIISPLMDAIVLTPLNPHVLTVRPIVFSAKDTLKLEINRPTEECILQLDGRNSFVIKENHQIIIGAAKKKVKFIKLSNRTFYQILRKKFHMGRK